MRHQLTGARLGNYHVRELLGSGGMASVYKGYDPALDREVAIKVLGAAEGGDFVARFQREARVVARLRHVNIVQIYHFGVEHDIAYMVQELLPGPTLAQRMREAGRRRVAAERVHAIVGQLAAALDFAHAQGVIHRDVKPSNALYNAQGQLVLTDFGIARSSADAAHTATGPGVVMGTPSYLAPEQAISSATLTRACDIYALGVVLFELLTGRLPFEADTPMGVVLKHLYDAAPPPSSLRPDLPSAVDRVVLRALDKEPAARHPSAGALAEALRSEWPASRKVTQPAVERRARPAAPAARAAATAAPKSRAVAAARPASKVAALPARPAAAKPALPKVRVRDSQPPPARRRQSLGRLRVGVLTADVVGALILVGVRPNVFAEALRGLRWLLGY